MVVVAVILIGSLSFPMWETSRLLGNRFSDFSGLKMDFGRLILAICNSERVPSIHLQGILNDDR